MRDNLWSTSLRLMVLLFVSGITWAQVQRHTRTLVINGRSGQAEVVEIDGRAYVDPEALAQIANGSLHFESNRILLTLRISTESAPTSVPPPSPLDEASFSRDFMKAGIEAIAGMREWASTLAYAIQNGDQVTESWAATYQEQASHSVILASIAASSEADRNAFQLLNSEFEAVRQWSNKLVEARKSLDGKYAVSANALRDDPLSRKIVTCGHFLSSMLGSRSFQDNPSCH